MRCLRNHGPARQRNDYYIAAGAVTIDGASPVGNCHQRIFRPNWISRGDILSLVIFPKLELLKLLFGLPNTVWFGVLNDSARNCTVSLSSFASFSRATSKSTIPGIWNPLRGASPGKCTAVGHTARVGQPGSANELLSHQ